MTLQPQTRVCGQCHCCCLLRQPDFCPRPPFHHSMGLVTAVSVSPAHFLSRACCRNRALGGGGLPLVVCPHGLLHPPGPTLVPSLTGHVALWPACLASCHLCARPLLRCSLGTGGSRPGPPSPAPPHLRPGDSPCSPRCLSTLLLQDTCPEGTHQFCLPPPLPFVV